MTLQEQEHKIDPGVVFCTIGTCMCFIIGLAIGIIISHDNNTNTEKSRALTSIPPPPNPTSETLNISETPIPSLILSNASNHNIESIQTTDTKKHLRYLTLALRSASDFL